VLYSPTWFDPNGFSTFSRYVVPVMRTLGGYNVIVKPHANILRYRPWEIAKARIVKGPRCVIKAKSQNVLPYMAVSDLMITDISSVAQEYLPFGKPLVFANPKPGRAIPEEHTWIWRCGDVVNDPRELPDIVRKNIEDPERHADERADALERIFIPFDGKCAGRFRNALERVFQSSIELRMGVPNLLFKKKIVSPELWFVLSYLRPYLLGLAGVFALTFGPELLVHECSPSSARNSSSSSFRPKRYTFYTGTSYHIGDHISQGVSPVLKAYSMRAITQSVVKKIRDDFSAT